MYASILRAINTDYVKPEEASWEGLLNQLNEMNEQAKRKDAHMDAALERNKELNILVGGLQNKLGALPERTRRADVRGDDEDNQPEETEAN